MSEAIDVFSDGVNAAGASLIARSGGAAVSQRARNVDSRFETMARLARVRSPQSERVLRVLLDATHADDNAGCEVLKPLWAEEGMHRAYSLLRLISAHAHRGDWSPRGVLAPGMREALARDLAAQYRLLQTADERRVAPCSRVLRCVVTDLAALFGLRDNIALETDIDWVELPGYKCRALVLAAAELVTNALLHAFHGRVGGRIVVSLTLCGLSRAVLRVSDDGAGFIGARPNFGCGVASGMAGLLEANVSYDRLDRLTIATIAFPLEEPHGQAVTSADPGADDDGRASIENLAWNERVS
jgi:hypothetical protein